MKQIQKISSAVFKNFCKIMGLSGTMIERIRDIAMTSTSGFPTNLNMIFTEIYKDDVLQPKASAELRLLEFTIKTWFGKHKLEIQGDAVKQTKLLKLFIETNDKMI